jgi:transcriptional regulator with XRE-family HTH domain
MDKTPKKNRTSGEARQQSLPLSWGPEEDLKSPDSPPESPVRKEVPSNTLPEPEKPVRSEPEPESQPALTEAAAPEPASELESKPPVEFIKLETSVGQTLREARSNRSLTIAEVCAATKITPEFVKSIEADRLGDLPPLLYTKSYVSKLCLEYSIDPAPLIASLSEDNIGGEEDSGGGHYVVTGGNGENPSRVQYDLAGGPQELNLGGGVNPARILVTVVLGVLLILVLAAAAMQLRLRWQRHRATQASEAQPTTEQTQPAEHAPGVVNLDAFIIPQQLPFKELPVPEN